MFTNLSLLLRDLIVRNFVCACNFESTSKLRYNQFSLNTLYLIADSINSTSDFAGTKEGRNRDSLQN